MVRHAVLGIELGRAQLIMTIRLETIFQLAVQPLTTFILMMALNTVPLSANQFIKTQSQRLKLPLLLRLLIRP
jgi:hypothetical protein